MTHSNPQLFKTNFKSLNQNLHAEIGPWMFARTAISCHELCLFSPLFCESSCAFSQISILFPVNAKICWFNLFHRPKPKSSFLVLNSQHFYKILSSFLCQNLRNFNCKIHFWSYDCLPLGAKTLRILRGFVEKKSSALSIHSQANSQGIHGTLTRG